MILLLLLPLPLPLPLPLLLLVIPAKAGIQGLSTLYPQRRRAKKNYPPSFRSPAALGSLFFACPKKSNQKKRQFPDKSILRPAKE
ncbi:hypothetical protein ACHZ97_15655 [Lysobacter soli]|uniref:hypothetical protein n=1 Tax=Lysobacter soli TaxID=453783 RepID=UPI0037C950EB